jgi:hypothetical protein
VSPIDKEENVNKYPPQNPLTLFSARLDQGAEVFMKKMFTHLKSKARERLMGKTDRPDKIGLDGGSHSGVDKLDQSPSDKMKIP